MSIVGKSAAKVGSPLLGLVGRTKEARNVDAQVVDDAVKNLHVVLNDEIERELAKFALLGPGGVPKGPTLEVIALGEECSLWSGGSKHSEKTMLDHSVAHVWNVGARVMFDPALKARVEVEVLEPLRARLLANGCSEVTLRFHRPEGSPTLTILLRATIPD